MKRLIAILCSMCIALIIIYLTTSTIYSSFKKDLREDIWINELINIVFFLITYIYSINLIMRSFIKEYYLKKWLNKLSQIFCILFVVFIIYLSVERYQEKTILIGWAVSSTLLISSLIYVEIYYNRYTDIKNPSN